MAFGGARMPGEPGPRLIGGAPHDSDYPRHHGADTPYNWTANVPTSTWTVGGTTYVHVAGNERRINP